jgi:hypothetical protein
VLDHATLTLQNAKSEAPQKMFSYQMPTVYDQQSKTVITGDWQTKHILTYKDQAWSFIRPQ